MPTINRPSYSLSGDQEELIHHICDQFAIEGEYSGGEEVPSGHINSTYRVSYDREGGGTRRYILQRINESVFKDPLAVMRNVARRRCGT